ncbi:MAG: hypothetical protein LIO68_02805 [Rikenellaceae bacterium]|nr:hypothetical protein [Rikenellaceae bacterium]
MHEDGTVEVLAFNTVHRQPLTINRKYPKHPDFDRYEKEMIGGWFEGANRTDFSDATTLLTIVRQQACQIERLAVPTKYTTQPYRYISTQCGNLAEVEFYSGNVPLTGKPIGFAGEVPEREPGALFDGNMESFFNTPDTTGIWAGVDLCVPKTITEIAVAAQTDDNEIRLGDTYQLYYWQDGWRPTPAAVAGDYRLTWTDRQILFICCATSRGAWNKGRSLTRRGSRYGGKHKNRFS